MKVWVTKYAMTKGILEMTVERSESSPSMVSTLGGSFGSFKQYFHGEGKDWHLTREGAVKRAEEMRSKKLKALDKAKRKVESLKF